MSGLTADGVLNAKFQPTRFREGYDQDEVDDFLDRVIALLRSHDAGAPAAGAAIAELCRDARFTPTKLREGYDQREVESLLERLSPGSRSVAVGDDGAPTTAHTASPGGATATTGGTPGVVEARTPSALTTVLVVATILGALAVLAVAFLL